MKRLSYDEVTLTEGIFLEAKKADVRFIKKLNPDRLLSGFRRSAGLPDLGCAPYGGWEDSRIGGHTMGHYLTALAQYVRKSNDSEMRARLNYLVEELSKCQNAHGNGFLFGAKLDSGELPEDQFDHEEGRKDATSWVPWYTMHKIFAGLLACEKLCGIAQALTVAEALGNWVYERTQKWDEHAQMRVFHAEYGGMGDCLYELAQMTGKDKYKLAARHFEDVALLEELSDDTLDALHGQHANSTLPKFLGGMYEHPQLGEKLWNKVVAHHAYATGGISDMEHFHEDDNLDHRRTQCNCEGCCNHNMLKLSTRLYERSQDVKYIEYMERVLFNAMLGSINTEDGSTAYFTPMATGYNKTFSNPNPDDSIFWCCTGTGMENYTKVEEQIYWSEGEHLYVNQYINSKVEYGDLKYEQRITFDEQMKVEIDCECEGEHVLHLRIPTWSEGKPQIQEIQNAVIGDKYIEVIVDGKCSMAVCFPMKIQTHTLPDDGAVVCFSYGPFVLAARLGDEQLEYKKNAGIEVIASGIKVIGNQQAEPEIVYGETHREVLDNEHLKKLSNEPFEKLLIPYKDEKLAFELVGTNASKKVGYPLIFVPFYRIVKERYGIYWYIEQ